MGEALPAHATADNAPPEKGKVPLVIIKDGENDDTPTVISGAVTARSRPGAPPRPVSVCAGDMDTQFDDVGSVDGDPGVAPSGSSINGHYRAKGLESARNTAYDLRTVIATGSFGEVWEAEQIAVGRMVAVKRLRRQLYERQPRSLLDRLETMFHQEAVVTGLLEHPNIVPMHDIGLDDQGRIFYAMKLVNGKNWNDQINEDRNMPLHQYLSKHLRIMIHVIQAVAFAHSHGIVHRDLKPSQVMLGEFGEVMLMDWGLAVFYDTQKAFGTSSDQANAPHIVTLDNAANPAGSPAYMAPEQTADTAEEIGPWTDIFLLGGMLYKLLTGQTPHQHGSAEDLFEPARRCQIVPPKIVSAEVPRELSILCMKTLARDPHARVSSARQLLEEIQNYLDTAGKRRKAQQATIDARAIADSARGNYAKLSECDNLLAYALGLWHDNPEASSLRQRVLADYSHTAIDNNDLIMARVQAERLDEGEERSELLAEIEVLERLAEMSTQEVYRAEKALSEAESQSRDDSEMRQELLKEIADLRESLDAARKEIEEMSAANSAAEERAMEAEKRAVDVEQQLGQAGLGQADFRRPVHGSDYHVEALMTSLLTWLATRGDRECLEVAEDHARKLIAHLESVPEESCVPETKFQHAMSFVTLADIEGEKQNLPAALQAYAKSALMLQELIRSESARPEWETALAANRGKVESILKRLYGI